MRHAPKARRVRLYLSEGDRAGHRLAHLAVMELLRKEGAAGAVCFRGLEGFGAGRDLHVAHLVDVDARLPLVIEWVDASGRVERILPAVRALVPKAMVTVDDTEIVTRARRADPAGPARAHGRRRDDARGGGGRGGHAGDGGRPAHGADRAARAPVIEGGRRWASSPRVI